MKTLLSAASLLLLCFSLAPAQIFSSVEFNSNTPFVAGNATLPPGTYIIRLTDDPSMLEIANPPGSISVLIEVEPFSTYSPAKRTAVIFNKYGEHLVLKSVTVQGQENGALSSTEMAERRHMQSHGKPTRVEVPAKIYAE